MESVSFSGATIPLTDRLLTPIEAGTMLGLKASTLADWRYAGVGPTYIRLAPNAVRYRLSDLLRYIASQKSVNPPEEEVRWSRRPPTIYSDGN
jgi:predicted DNA-binding transcriptional regulator AlpA